jgi:hypothetical protein
MGDDDLETMESRLLDMTEALDGDRLRWKEVRMVEKERDWKRDVLIFGVMIDWGIELLGGRERPKTGQKYDEDEDWSGPGRRGVVNRGWRWAGT